MLVLVKKSLRKDIMIVLHLFILALIQRFVDVTVSILPYFKEFDPGKPMILSTKKHARNSFFKGLNNIPSSSLGVNQHTSGSIEIDAQGNIMNFKSKKEKINSATIQFKKNTLKNIVNPATEQNTA